MERKALPRFRYKGFRSDGEEIAGGLEAAGRGDALARLRADGIYPVCLEEERDARKPWIRRSDRSFLPSMTRQLATLLAAGVPILDAFQGLAAEEKGRRRQVLLALRERLAGGSSLCRALEEQEGLFPPFYLSLVQAGEATGALDQILARMADFLEHQDRIKARVRSALAYPLLMLGVGGLVLVFLFSFVIPKMVRIFSDLGAALPWITRVLIRLSDLFQRHGWVLALAALGLAWGGRRLLKTRRILVDRLLLRLPGGVFSNLYFARFSRTMGFLLGGGLPLPQALKIASRAIGNEALAASVRAADAGVAEGQRLSASLPLFPPVLLQLIATGEKSGDLAGMLARAADAYEEAFQRKLAGAVSLLEPAMILLMGAVVCFVVLAVLLPLFQLNQLVR